MDDVPAVYSQMVRSLLRGEPMDAPGVVDRTNVSETQSAAQNRVHSDSIWYARLGYGAYFADQSYGGPAVGFLGTGAKESLRNRCLLAELSVQVVGSDVRLPVARRQFRHDRDVVEARSSPLLLSCRRSESVRRCGLSLSATNLDHGNTYWEGKRDPF
jgi:hypothetical protein